MVSKSRYKVAGRKIVLRQWTICAVAVDHDLQGSQGHPDNIFPHVALVVHFCRFIIIPNLSSLQKNVFNFERLSTYFTMKLEA